MANMIPLLNVDHLDDEQLAYECQLRHLAFSPITPEIIATLKQKITNYVGNPTELVYETELVSEEGQENELNRCIAGIKLIIQRYQSIPLAQRLHRTIHYYYRLKRISQVESKQRLQRYIVRAFELIKVLQQAHPKDPIPESFLTWARTSNITTDSLESEVGTQDNINTNPNTHAIINHRVNIHPNTNPSQNTVKNVQSDLRMNAPYAIPDDTEGARSVPNVSKPYTGTKPKQTQQNGSNPDNVAEDFMHSTMIGQAYIIDDVMRAMSDIRKHQRDVDRQNAKKFEDQNEQNRRLMDLQTHLLEAIRAGNKSQVNLVSTNPPIVNDGIVPPMYPPQVQMDPPANSYHSQPNLNLSHAYSGQAQVHPPFVNKSII